MPTSISNPQSQILNPRSSVLAPSSQILNPKISILVAMAKNRVIGINNTLPWHLPADLKHFKALTMGHHILMGRKTYESIGKPLPGRTSVVITRNVDYSAEGVTIAHTLESGIAMCSDDPEIFIIGGAELYRQAIHLANRIYLTEIELEITGDAHFTELDKNAWQESSRISHAPDEKNCITTIL
jgi:dihydrofolate reductase